MYQPGVMWYSVLIACLWCWRRTITQGPATLVCDPVSYEFVRGSTIDYTTDLIRSAFEVRPCTAGTFVMLQTLPAL